ncbi:MAG: hypothetical protein H6745_18770 [Deltaproteobacteria bacterium]|nr:hypothetical protein [Deltaproteobacteria bacterium]
MAADPRELAADDAPAPPRREAEGLAWRALTSPRTFGVLLLALALWLAVAAFVPQRATAPELLARMSYPVADAARALGLADALTTWPALLLAVLIALNLGGMAFRAAFARARHGEEALRPGPFVSAAAATLDVPAATLRGRLAGALGGAVRTRGAGLAVTAVRGRWGEGLGLLLLGALALGGGLVADRAAGLEARLTTVLGSAPDADTNRAQVHHGALWLDQVLPFELSCAPPDPLDPARVSACAFRSPAGSAEVRLAPGYPAEVDGATFTLTDATTTLPAAGSPSRFLVKTQASGGWAQLELAPGASMKLGDGDQTLLAVPGPDGPLVVASHPGAAPVLLAPRLDAGPVVPAAGGLELAWIPEQQVTIAVATAPGQPFVWVGLGLVALGGLLLLLLPHAQVTLTPRGERTFVQVWSANRPALPEATLAALAGAAPRAAAPPVAVEVAS